MVAHRAIPRARESAARVTGVAVTWDWLGPDTLAGRQHPLIHAFVRTAAAAATR